MYLTQIGKNENQTATHIEIEKIADDLLMVSIDNNTNDQAQVFSYWRVLGDTNNPPLEVGINTETGTIKSITFFVDINCFKEFSFSQKNELFGNILLDTNIFSRANDYITNQGNYIVALDGNRFMCKFNGNCDIKKTIVNENIEFYMDDKAQLRGFAIRRLAESELKTINSLFTGN